MIRQVQSEVDGVLSPTWRGYCLRFGEDARIEWRGTFRGYETRLRRGKGNIVRPGLRTLAEFGT